MRQYLVEITFLLYGLYLLHELQYLSLLILLVLSLILIMKGIQHKESLVITMVILLFTTQYHRYFPSRNNINNEIKIINTIHEILDSFTGFEKTVNPYGNGDASMKIVNYLLNKN